MIVTIFCQGAEKERDYERSGGGEVVGDRCWGRVGGELLVKRDSDRSNLDQRTVGIATMVCKKQPE